MKRLSVECVLLNRFISFRWSSEEGIGPQGTFERAKDPDKYPEVNTLRSYLPYRQSNNTIAALHLMFYSTT